MTCTHYTHFGSLVPPLAEPKKAKLHTAPVDQSTGPPLKRRAVWSAAQDEALRKFVYSYGVKNSVHDIERKLQAITDKDQLADIQQFSASTIRSRMRTLGIV